MIRKIWMHKWGHFGRSISKLDIPEDYIVIEHPDKYVENGLGYCGYECGGKDLKTEA